MFKPNLSLASIEGVADAKALVLADPFDPIRYLELSRYAEQARDGRLSATTYALTLVCIGRPSPSTRHLFENRWFLLESRYVLFYFGMAIPIRSRVADIHILERRIAAGEVRVTRRRTTAFAALALVPPTNIDRPPVLLCGMPKSASTFLSHCIAGSLGFRVRTPHSVDDGVGTGFDLVNLLRASEPDMIVHSHFAANPRVLAHIRVWKLRPVVIIRNLFDALRSYADHLRGAAQRLDTRDAVDWQRAAVLRMAHHYVELYASWQRAIAKGIPAHVVRYDDIRNEPVAVVRDVLQFVGLDAAPEDIAAAVAKAQQPEYRRAVRFNIGVNGRGAEIDMTSRSFVRTLYELYPDVSFKEIDPEV